MNTEFKNLKKLTKNLSFSKAEEDIIDRASSAILNHSFYSQIGKNPQEIISTAIE